MEYQVEAKLEMAKLHLNNMKEFKGNHTRFGTTTSSFMFQAYSIYEYLEDEVGGHEGSRSNHGELFDWLGNKFGDERHERMTVTQHADLDEGRTPDGQPDVDVYFESRDGDHYYHFSDPPKNRENCTICEIAEEILHKLEVLIENGRYKDDAGPKISDAFDNIDESEF